MTTHDTVVEYPTELDIVITKAFDAPAETVFSALWDEENVRRTIAPFGETVTVCDIDLRTGGDYHFVFVPDGGEPCSFRGTFREVDRPRRTEQTWHFDGWPDVDAVESFDLAEADGVTTLTYRLAYPDLAARAHMTKVDGLLANVDHVAALVAELVDRAS